MKPTKNWMYCRDSNRKKILFESEKKANNFIKFNAEEIKSQSGYCPTRSYFCITCGGYHTTSKTNEPKTNRTETIINHYHKLKKKK